MRPITIVVGYTPGATSDLLARTVGERLSAAWGQSVIVENRSGVGGNIGAGYVARAQPDGYTLMVGTDAMMTSNVYLYKSTPFDPVKDFAPITYAGANIICLAVTPIAGQLGGRPDRLRQGQSRQAAVRLVRHRLAASSRRRAPAPEDRHRHRTCPIAAAAPPSTICSAATSRWRS